MQTRDRTGQQFGNYRLTHLIGRGGYAEVYLAQNVLLNNLQYAIKVLTGTNLMEKQREEFLAEARTIANLQRLSSHIVQINDFGIQPDEDAEDGAIPYFVMEYAAEGTLRNRYPHETKVPLECIALYVNQVAEALQCAHNQKPPIIHCDVKPENMLLRSSNHLLLSDFGIAIAGRTSTQRAPTREMAVVGTATYIAPERLASKQTGRASDQYSLGIVVYEWLCGFPPFEGLDMEICYKQMTEPPPSLSQAYPEITQEIEAVVMRALKKKPADRYATVTEFAKALERAINDALQRNQPRLLPMSKGPSSPRYQPESQMIGSTGKAQPTVTEPTLPSQQPITLPSTQLAGPRPASPFQKAEPLMLPQAQQSLTEPTLPSQQPLTEPTLPSQQPTILPSTQLAGPRPASPVQRTKPLALSQAQQPLVLSPVIKQPPAQIPSFNVQPTIEESPFQQKLAPGQVVWHDLPDITEPDRRGGKLQARPTSTKRSKAKTRTSKTKAKKREVRSFFELSPYFIQDQQHSIFIYGGIMCNVFSALGVGLLQKNVFTLFGGVAFSLTMFGLSVFVVEEALATFFATLVAVYWLVIGWTIGSFLAALLNLNPLLPPVFTSIVFFGTSLCLNVWYTSRKNL